MTSYPRRTRLTPAQVPRRASLSDDETSSSTRLTTVSSPRSSSPLSPPRPSFLASNTARGSAYTSASSQDSDFAPGSDSERDLTPPNTVVGHGRRKSVGAAGYAPVVDVETPPPSAGLIPSQSLHSATQLPPAPTPYVDESPRSSRAPPSSFPFPFQLYPGNPDPGTAIPGLGLKSRRASVESFGASHARRPTSGTGSMDVSWEADLERPNAPFMAGGGPQVYRAGQADRGSTHSFRSPFLSPASRPSSMWSPPSHASYPMLPSSPNLPHEPLKPKPPLPSTLLVAKLDMEDKPWLAARPDRRTRGSWWITLLVFFVGIGIAGVLCWRGYVAAGKTMIDPSRLCAVMEDNFDTLDVDNGGTWARDAELSGFGNGEFEMTTTSSDNLFVRNGQLYIKPTLTSNYLANPNLVLDGGKYTIPGCTVAKTNASACSASSNAKTGATIPPVMSARISTKASYAIQFGKVEIVAKLPRGDWLWPAIWMLPVDNKYGAWPLSGEIDIMEARGNGPTYPAQGDNFARASLAWGPLPGLIARAYGWQSQKRTSYAAGFHTYTLEWTQEFMKVYVDSRLKAMLDLTMNSKVAADGGYFFHRGKFPVTATNGTATEIVVPNPWKDAGQAAPFDQNFYLIINLAAGGTSGWFPDNKGGKMWYDGSATAMRDFARAQSTWTSTWPDDDDDLAFRIDSVKMWKLC